MKQSVSSDCNSPRAPFTGSGNGASMAVSCVDTYHSCRLEHCSHCDWLTDWLMGCCKYVVGKRGGYTWAVDTAHLLLRDKTTLMEMQEEKLELQLNQLLFFKASTKQRKKLLATVKTPFSPHLMLLLPLFLCCLNLLLATTTASEAGSQEITLFEQHVAQWVALWLPGQMSVVSHLTL